MEYMTAEQSLKKNWITPNLTDTPRAPEFWEDGYKTGYNDLIKQITEEPEPVNYLDIPKDLQWSIDGNLWGNNGVEIDSLTTPTCEKFTGIQVKDNNWVVDRSWIKQKQPEPTREELQERLKEVVRLCKKWALTPIIDSILNAATKGKT